MTTTERVEIASMVVKPLGQIEIRTDTITEKDGKEISRTIHRRVILPHHNTDNEVKFIRDKCVEVHTPEVQLKWLEESTKVYLSRGL
jgi:L-ascorbate metabolism protein UlaG (beta-lactamase superfamily)